MTTGGVAGHYASLDRPDDQTSPAPVRTMLDRWIEATALDGTVLDVGTGVGNNLRQLDGRATTIGTDISTAVLRTSRAIAPVVAADGAHLPFADGAFDAAVCTEVLEHVDDVGAVVAEIARVVRPGGSALVTTPNYANLAGLHKWLADRRSGRTDWNPWGAHQGGHEGFMTGRRLAAAVRPHFEIVTVHALDYGQALTGRFRALDRLAWTRLGRRLLARLLPALEGRDHGLIPWHGMHVALVLRKPAHDATPPD